MTPRTDVVMIRLGMPWTEIIDFVVESGHTRIPVYEKTRDNGIGILNAKDLLGVLARAADRPLPDFGSILRRPHFVPATKKLDDVLAEFRKTRNHIAVVLDEYGGVSGLVTIEDVLEEIVGDIADEYDEIHVDEIREIDDRTREMSARVHLDEINERLGINLPDEEEFDTIGGFVFHELGRIPAAGEELERNGVRIQVVSATRRQIEKVRIILPEPRKEAV
jgi:CBS domain containing-hemolysin-like protein